MAEPKDETVKKPANKDDSKPGHYGQQGGSGGGFPPGKELPQPGQGEQGGQQGGDGGGFRK